MRKANTRRQIYVGYHANQYQIRGSADEGARHAGYHPDANHRHVIQATEMLSGRGKKLEKEKERERTRRPTVQSVGADTDIAAIREFRAALGSANYDLIR